MAHRLLINAKADLDAAMDSGSTPLSEAASKGWTDILKLLIQSGAKLASTNVQACYYQVLKAAAALRVGTRLYLLGWTLACLASEEFWCSALCRNLVVQWLCPRPSLMATGMPCTRS